MHEAKFSEDKRKIWREQKRRSRARQRDAAALQGFPMGDFSCDGGFDLYIMRYDFDPCQTMGSARLAAARAFRFALGSSQRATASR